MCHNLFGMCPTLSQSDPKLITRIPCNSAQFLTICLNWGLQTLGQLPSGQADELANLVAWPAPRLLEAAVEVVWQSPVGVGGVIIVKDVLPGWLTDHMRAGRTPT